MEFQGMRITLQRVCAAYSGFCFFLLYSTLLPVAMATNSYLPSLSRRFDDLK